MGRITSQDFDQNGNIIATLSHTIAFEDGSVIETSGDQAFLNPAPDYNYCVFEHVEEIISNFWGTKTFKRATGEIIATGSIYGEDCGNKNGFTLTGTVCLSKDRD
jgi:hypothetical protein